jgi:prepilin peptidase CpaA
MMLWSGQWRKHYDQFWFILNEVITVKDPNKLEVLAAQRKPSMLLLPYGIPIAIGTILYFMWTGMLV